MTAATVLSVEYFGASTKFGTNLVTGNTSSIHSNPLFLPVPASIPPMISSASIMLGSNLSKAIWILFPSGNSSAVIIKSTYPSSSKVAINSFSGVNWIVSFIIPSSFIFIVLSSPIGTLSWVTLFLWVLGSRTFISTIGATPNLLKCASIASHNV